MKPQSFVLGIAGQTGSGKSKLSLSFAQEMGWNYANFTEEARLEARKQGWDESQPEILQRAGALLIDRGEEEFCHLVIGQAPQWERGASSLVVNSVHHLKVNQVLKKLVAPSVYLLIYIDVADEKRKEQLQQEGVTDEERLKRIEADSTEIEVESALRKEADIRLELDGTEPLPVLIEALKSQLVLKNDGFKSANNITEDFHIEPNKKYHCEHKSWRSLVRVLNVNGVGEQRSLDVIIPSWHPHRPINLAFSRLPEELWDNLRPGARLLAMVNLAATESEDLILSNFELASEPISEDDLA